MSFINNAAQLNSLQPDQEIMLGFEDLLLRELRVTTNPLSLKELQVKISPVRPVTAIIVAASLNRLCIKDKVVRKLVGKASTLRVLRKTQRTNRFFEGRRSLNLVDEIQKKVDRYSNLSPAKCQHVLQLTQQ
jgi:hypothetical protein